MRGLGKKIIHTIKAPYEWGNQVNLKYDKLNNDNISYISKFKCENREMERFFKNEALKDNESVTYLSIDEERDVIVSILTISATAIFMMKPNKRKDYNYFISAIEVKKFAVNTEYKHMKYSEDRDTTLSMELFMRYIDQIHIISQEIVGASKIVLYSVPEAYNFYKKCRFRDFDSFMQKDDTPYLKGCKPMFLSLNS